MARSTDNTLCGSASDGTGNRIMNISVPMNVIALLEAFAYEGRLTKRDIFLRGAWEFMLNHADKLNNGGAFGTALDANGGWPDLPEIDELPVVKQVQATPVFIRPPVARAESPASMGQAGAPARGRGRPPKGGWSGDFYAKEYHNDAREVQQQWVMVPAWGDWHKSAEGVQWRLEHGLEEGSPLLDCIATMIRDGKVITPTPPGYVPPAPSPAEARMATANAVATANARAMLDNADDDLPDVMPKPTDYGMFGADDDEEGAA